MNKAGVAAIGLLIVLNLGKVRLLLAVHGLSRVTIYLLFCWLDGGRVSHVVVERA